MCPQNDDLSHDMSTGPAVKRSNTTGTPPAKIVCNLMSKPIGLEDYHRISKPVW